MIGVGGQGGGGRGACGSPTGWKLEKVESEEEKTKSFKKLQSIVSTAATLNPLVSPAIAARPQSVFSQFHCGPFVVFFPFTQRFPCNAFSLKCLIK